MKHTQLDQLWAKTNPFQSVLTHSALTGLIAQVLLTELLSPGSLGLLASALGMSGDALRQWIGYFVSLHDLGKVEELFQWKWDKMHSYLLECGLGTAFRSRPNSVRHECTTLIALKTELWSQCDGDRQSKRLLTDVLAAHHQGKHGKWGDMDSAAWRKLRAELEQAMRKYFLQDSVPTIPTVDYSQCGQAGVLLLGLVIASDWIASGVWFSDAQEWFHLPHGKATAVQRTKQFLAQSGLQRQNVQFPPAFSKLWPSIAEMRGLQQETEALFQETEGPISLVLLEAPMGEGKTEAGVYAAVQMARQWGKDGFYIGMPTAATANQMVERMRSLLLAHAPEEQVRLLHSTAWLTDDEAEPSGFQTEEEAYAAQWLMPMRRAMLSSFAVGTVDQAMFSVLNVKYGVFRLLGLSNKVLVIDELHSYDLYMRDILVRLLEWCKALEIPVVLLSATLPPEKKQALLSPYTTQPLQKVYPAVTAVTASGRVMQRRVERTEKKSVLSVELEPILNCVSEIAAYVTQQTQAGGCTCVLMNTVKQAQQVYQEIRRTGFDGTLLLFHARFPVQRRSQIEEVCVRLFGKDKSHRPAKAILVATQVVEQSLDVDFDRMITAVAPIDLLLQRSGRVFRHSDTPRPEGLHCPRLVVLIPERPGDDLSDAVVYPACLLNQSIRLLKQRQTIRIPEDIPALVEQGYDPNAAPEAEIDKWREQLLEEQVSASVSRVYLIQSPEKGYTPIRRPYEVLFDDLEENSFLSAKTRLGEPTTKVVLIPDEQFLRLQNSAAIRNEKPTLEHIDRAACRELMMESVSLRLTQIRQIAASVPVLYGRGMLSCVTIYAAQEDGRGRLYVPGENGTRLVSDMELGMIWEVGEET